ncbi:hypothetical protein GOV04_05640 [Candidatus Woesearchaeota archaeon]|nr:hypothetical protein [Candidatus Woesearchaeota archaeon]
MGPDKRIKELELIKTLIDKVSQDYQITPADIIKQLAEPTDTIDAAAFSNKLLSPTQVLVKCLRENKFSKLADIARFLKRNQNTIQTTYKKAQEKQPSKITYRSSLYKVPLEVFSTKQFTVFESLVKYLRESENLSNKQIASLLSKSNKTIWTVYARTKTKNEQEKN